MLARNKCCRNNTSLNKRTKWSTVLKQLSPLEDFMFIKKSLAHDPYSCAIKAKHEYFTGWKTVGHIPREISRYVYFFIKQKGGRVYGKPKSLKHKPSPIPSGGPTVTQI